LLPACQLISTKDEASRTTIVMVKAVVPQSKFDRCLLIAGTILAKR
jgi:hypothetical protein